MRRVGVLGNGQVLPLGNVVVGDAGIIGGIVAVAGQVGNDRHGLDPDHALQGQVGLIANKPVSDSIITEHRGNSR